MKYIREYREGDRMSGIYLCKHRQQATTKNGKPYVNVILQDRTGTVDAKIWEPNNMGIEEFDPLDYIEVYGEVINYQGTLQVNLRRLRRCREGEYNPADYLPVSGRDNDEMYGELLRYVAGIQNPSLHTLAEAFFVKDSEFIRAFRQSSAAKTIHHGFVGGLLEHTVSVTKLCDFYCEAYPFLKRDLLLTAALCHDIGKVRELSPFPVNDYTDEGQLLGHIVIGAQMVHEKISQIPDFSPVLAEELTHCILSHHGEYEFGSPKKPELPEAVALNFADNTDAKLETFKELLQADSSGGWLGYNRLFEANLRASRME